MCVFLAELPPRIDSMKEFFWNMRKSREKLAVQQRSNKTNEKEPLVKYMATSVVDFLTEGMGSSHDSPCQDEMHNKDGEHNTQTCTSPTTVAAAMGNQQLRAQVSNMLNHYCSLLSLITVYVHLPSVIEREFNH